MKQATKTLNEIRELNAAIHKSKSPKLKRDYSKAMRRKIKDLKEYCMYRGISLEELI